MEKLIRIQLAQKEILEKFITNYKKDGKDRRTQSYYEKRLQDFQELWDEFKSRHREILIIKYSDETFSEAEFDYFEEGVFEKMEEFFFANHSLITDRFRAEFPPIPSPSMSSTKEANDQKQGSFETSIKLPKICLEKFSGDYRKWPTFHDLFKSLVHTNSKLSPAQKLQYLKLHVSGEPEHLLRHFTVTDGNYLAAWDLLKERYDDKRVLVNTQLRVLLSQNAVSNESAQGVKGLLDTTTECLKALTNLEIDVSGWDPIVVYLIVQKLPPDTHQLWEQDVCKGKDLPSWQNLKEFLQARFRTLEAINSKGRLNSSDQRCQSKRVKAPAHSFHIATNASCVICLDNHSIRQCPKFLSLNPIKRMEVVKTKGLCINCLGSGHILIHCPSQQKCLHCKRSHHSLLHRNAAESSADNAVTNSSATRNRSQENYSSHRSSNHITNLNTQGNELNHGSLSQTLSAATPAFIPRSDPSTSVNLGSFAVSQCSREQVLLATALVKIVSPSGDERIVRALIDQGSQASFLTASIAQDLKLKRESVSASIQGVGSHVSQINCRVHFDLKSIQGNRIMKVSCFVLPKLTNLLPTKTIVHRNWAHIKGLELADPEFYNPSKIDLLLGADVYSHIMLNELIRGLEGTPLAQKTLLGWILSGKIHDENENSIHINNFHVNVDLNSQLKLFWELEEVQNRKEYTDEEKTCENFFAETHKRLPDGRYEVELPFRKETPYNYLGKSRSIALARLHQMEKRFQKDLALKEEYVKCLKEYLALGHMERVKSNEDDHAVHNNGTISYSCSYLPHHGVIKESSTTTKLRVVFDASRPTDSGISLNDRLLKGAVLQDDLTALLLRWRKHRVVVTADLEKMYRQIRVERNHSEYQRIVWRESPKEPVQDYKLLTVTFGTKSAPYLATRVLKQLAIDEKNKFPIGSKVTLSDFYVDDLLSGADTIEAALTMQGELMELMKSGKFLLRKWSSNCKELLESLPKEDCESNMLFNVNCEEGIKTLGTHWNPHNDIFTYSINFEKEPPTWTKRYILSEVSKLFDPLGLLAPSIILAKILIQKLWLSGLGWDDEISSDLKQEWLTYRKKLIAVENLQISRWIRFSESDIEVELHGFSDASIKAYSAAVYMCTTNLRGERHAALITAKTKVAPIKVVSLPRLELCGAVLLAKLLVYVKEALSSSKPVSIYAWTDSEIVLAWLKAHPVKWTTFVANRESHIHDLLKQNIWSHVGSKENPADCASRGMFPDELKNYNLWWNGPNWLTKSPSEWPSNKKVIQTNLEQRKLVVHNTYIAAEDMETKYSSLTKLLRITAYCIRFAHNTKKSRTERDSGYLKAIELQYALNIWLKKSQHQQFAEEISSLSKNQSIHRKSRLLKLNPFLDSTGLMRVGGRLRHSNLSYNERHPIILSDKCHITKLIIEKTHKDTLHGGTQLMMYIIAKNYWLLNARTSIKQLLYKCIPCYRQRATAQTQLMGDLPIPRVQVTRPFTHTGVDYCGPFDLKTHKGRKPKKYKAYISLFVCMVTKALHLELVTDLSADGFIAAFRRFSSRRGLCHQIYCDCGTNFVGASKVLSKQQKQMADQLNEQIASLLENEGIKFNFIPPASPHFGGLWEAGVRSTKYHLKRVLGNTTLTFEEFNTILNQIEACLNSRPLCELSRDPDDLIPLTPAHFLIGQATLTPPEPSLLNIKINRLSRWQLLKRMYQDFWKRWNSEYLCRLQQRPKRARRTENVKIGDLVILKEENVPPSRWILARIIQTHPGSDGLVRVVTLKAKNTTLKRPITKICLLPINSTGQETSKEA